MILKVIMFLTMFQCDKITIDRNQQTVTTTMNREQVNKINDALNDESQKEAVREVFKDSVKKMKWFRDKHKLRIVFTY